MPPPSSSSLSAAIKRQKYQIREALQMHKPHTSSRKAQKSYYSVERQVKLPGADGVFYDDTEPRCAVVVNNSGNAFGHGYAKKLPSSIALLLLREEVDEKKYSGFEVMLLFEDGVDEDSKKAISGIDGLFYDQMLHVKLRVEDKKKKLHHCTRHLYDRDWNEDLPVGNKSLIIPTNGALVPRIGFEYEEVTLLGIEAYIDTYTLIDEVNSVWKILKKASSDEAIEYFVNQAAETLSRAPSVPRSKTAAQDPATQDKNWQAEVSGPAAQDSDWPA